MSPKPVRLIFILSHNCVSWKSLTEAPNRMPKDLQSDYGACAVCAYLTHPIYLVPQRETDRRQSSNRTQSPHFQRPRQCKPLSWNEGQGMLTSPKPCKSPVMEEMLFFFANSLLFSQRTNDAGEGSNVLDTGLIKQKCHCKAGGDNSGGKENTEWSVPGLGGAFIF